MKNFFEIVKVYLRGFHAGLVLKMDERFKRDPLVAERMKHIKAQFELLQLMFKNPATRKKLGPNLEQQVKLMGPTLLMMERALKKNPALKMNELKEAAQSPQLQQPQVRMRPGPPMRGRRRY